MAVTLFFKCLVLVTLFTGITCEWELTCDAANVQNKVECEPLDCPDGYTLEEGQGKCGYCSACVRYAQIGQPCTVDSPIITQQQQEIRMYDTTLCEKGLECQGQCVINETTDCKKNAGQCCYDKLLELNDILATETDRNKVTWVWNPQCKPSGQYKPVQCKGSRCYCTQENGNRIFGDMKMDIGTPGDINCKCSLMDEKLKEKSKQTTDFDHVNCQKNGNFKSLQCLRNMCFCVNETTGEMDGMVLPKSLIEKLPCYEEEFYQKSFEQRCQVQRANEENVARYYESKNIRLLDVTKCDPDGTYVPKQCDDVNCWCGKPDDGKAIEPNWMLPRQSSEQLTMNCYCLRDKDERGTVSQTTSCQRKGDHQPVKCVGSTCYCQDISDGHQSSVEQDLGKYKATPCDIPDDIPDNLKIVKACLCNYVPSY